MASGKLTIDVHILCLNDIHRTEKQSKEMELMH